MADVKIALLTCVTVLNEFIRPTGENAGTSGRFLQTPAKSWGKNNENSSMV